jgi:mannosidase alpha-like ER degradation enhancer 2
MDGDPRFLRLARDLADRLAPAFKTPTGMPYRYVHLRTGEVRGNVSNPAEIGTLILEWGTVSRLTGDPAYYEMTKSALKAVFERRSEISLVGSMIDVETGEWKDLNSHISGMIDSYYEYMLKGWMLFGDEELKSMFDESIQAVNRSLADETGNGLWYGHANMETGERTRTVFGALDCFFPGVLALSGDIDRARRLQESCFSMWTLHGIEPEQLDYNSMKVITEYYALRPENIESAYVLHEMTNDPRYLEMGKTYFHSLLKHCRTETGYAQLESVITKKKTDSMDSYFLAETLKYLYLIFAPRGTVDLSRTVFTTEAHPLKAVVPGTPQGK